MSSDENVSFKLLSPSEIQHMHEHVIGALNARIYDGTISWRIAEQYYRFVCMILDESLFPHHDELLALVDDALREGWKDYCRLINGGEIIVPTLQELERDFTRFMFERAPFKKLDQIVEFNAASLICTCKVALYRLTLRQRKFLEMFLGFDGTVYDDRQIAAELHIPRARIPEMQRESRSRIRSMKMRLRGDILTYKTFGGAELNRLMRENALLSEEVARLSETPEEKRAKVLHYEITEVEMSRRLQNRLEKLGIRYFGELVQMTEAELLAAKQFGPKLLAELKEVLAELGLELGMQVAFTRPV